MTVIGSAPRLPVTDTPAVRRFGRSTHLLLPRLGVALLVLALAAGAFSGMALRQIHRAAAVADARTVPAILAVSTAQSALVAADRAAVHSLESGEVQLSGSGGEYRSQMTIVNQSLAQAAENNTAGAAGTQTLQLVEGLLAAYMGAVEQAAFQFRVSGEKEALGTVDLWTASRLLYGPDGMFDQLDLLRQQQEAAFDRQLESGRISLAYVVGGVVSLVALLAFLCATQVFLSRRFRRTLNPALLLATVCVAAMIGLVSLAVVSLHRLEAADSDVAAAIRTASSYTESTAAQAQSGLGRLVRRQCAAPPAGTCGSTVDTYFGTVIDPQDVPKSAGPVAETAKAATAQVAAAAQPGKYTVLIPATTILVLALIVIGLYPRINEYGFRRR